MTSGRWLERALRAVRAALVVFGVWVVGSSASELLRSPALEIPAPGEPGPIVTREARALARYDVIARRNLFGGPAAPLALAATQSVAAASTLPVRLLGTIVSNPASRSLAVMGDDASDETVVVATGDRIGDAQVERIERDAVLVSRLGRLERIAFDDAPPLRATPARSARAGAPARRARAPAAASAAAAPAALRPPPVRAPRAQGRDLDALEEPGPPPASPDTEEALRTLASQARFLPEFGNGGEVRGIAVQSVVPGSTLDRLGLRSGDLVVSVAGHRVDDPASAQALRALPLHEPFAVEIVRAGAPATLRVPGGALVP